MAELRGTKMPSINKPALFINSKEESKRKKMGKLFTISIKPNGHRLAMNTSEL